METPPLAPEGAAPGPVAVGAASARLMSLDALRGFDMFWIMGMEELGEALHRVADGSVTRFVATQLTHVDWAGFRFLDLVFPLFVFISGVSMVFSLEKFRATHGPSAASVKLAKRALLLFLLGVFYSGGLAKGIDEIRWLGVLQRIALAGFAAGLVHLWVPRKAPWICGGLLVSYWALMTFMPANGFGAGDFTEGRNLANWIDSQWLPGRKYDGDHDPEGLLSTLPAISTALLGLMAGTWLRRTDRTPERKAVTLMLAGLVLVAAGWLWHWQFPVVKKLWTSSFVLVAGGWSAVLLGAFHWIIEVRDWRRWAVPFVWIGMNPITLYLSHGLVKYDSITARLIGGPVAEAFGAWKPVWLALGPIALTVLLAWFLHRRRLFLRV